MTDSGPEQNPFAPPDPSAAPPPPPPSWGAPVPPPQGWQPGPMWQPGAWTAPPPRRTSRLAVLALVTAIVLLIPVALVLSIAALVRMPRRDQTGKGLVYAALAVCAGWSLFFSLAIVVGVLGGFDPHSRGSVSTLPAIEPGTCLDSGLRQADCSTEHDLEVFFSPTLPDPVWPGKGDVANAADTLCKEAFAGYVGRSYDSSSLDYDFYAPTEADWTNDRHRIACVITTSDTLTGSVRGSDR